MEFRPPMDLQSLFPNMPPGPTPSDGAEAAAAGARLMALLAPHTASPSTAGVEPPVSSTSPEPRIEDSVGSGRKGTCGRVLVGSHVVYDCDVRVAGESQPQLEVMPITKYVTDPLLNPGRQIAVSRIYICYALRHGQIRILNINSALRALLKGHTQRVTDMAFFSDHDHLLASVSVDGMVCVRRLWESEIDGKMAIHQVLLCHVHLSGPWASEPSVCPVLCWHTAESVAVACGPTLFLLTLANLHSGDEWETAVGCTQEAVIEGVTILRPPQAPLLCLASAPGPSPILAGGCEDGKVVQWSRGGGGSRSAPAHPPPPCDQLPLPSPATRTHGGEAITPLSLPLLSYPTATPQGPAVIGGVQGPANRELKLWVASSLEGWRCIQTLELTASNTNTTNGSSSPALYNHVCVLPAAGLVLVGNACRPAIYVIHITLGEKVECSRLSYLAEFSVTMPILSFSARVDESIPGRVLLFCFQTEAIQQYTLKGEDCTPPEGSIQTQPQTRPPLPPPVHGAEEALIDLAPTSNPTPPPAVLPPPSAPPLPDLLSAPVPAPAPAPIPVPAPVAEAPTLSPLPLPTVSLSPPPVVEESPPAPSSEGGQGGNGTKQTGRRSKPKAVLPLAPLPAPLRTSLLPYPTAPSPHPPATDAALKAAIDQLVAGQQDLATRISSLLSAPIVKEGKRMEAALGQRVDKALKQAQDTQAIKGQEEAAWREHLRGCLVGEVESVVKAEVRSGMERMEAVVRSTLQDCMRASFAGVLVPAVERGCGAMVQQVQAMLEEMKKKRREGGAGVGAGAGEQALSLQAVEEGLDPTLDLSRLLKEGLVQEAFTKALSLSDLSTLAWLCAQLDPAAVLSSSPPRLDPLTQLSLSQQLGWDLSVEEEVKIKWLRHLVLMLNPSDPATAPHMRGALEQLYARLHTQLGGVAAAQAAELRLVMHVVNSLLTACK